MRYQAKSIPVRGGSLSVEHEDAFSGISIPEGPRERLANDAESDAVLKELFASSAGCTISEALSTAVSLMKGGWDPLHKHIAKALANAGNRNDYCAHEVAHALLEGCINSSRPEFSNLLNGVALAVSFARLEKDSFGRLKRSSDLFRETARRLITEKIADDSLDAEATRRLLFLGDFVEIVSDQDFPRILNEGHLPAIVERVMRTGFDLTNDRRLSEDNRVFALRGLLGDVVRDTTFAKALVREIIYQERDALSEEDFWTVRETIRCIVDQTPALRGYIRNVTIQRSGKSRGILAGVVLSELETFALGPESVTFHRLISHFDSVDDREVPGVVAALSVFATDHPDFATIAVDRICHRLGSTSVRSFSRVVESLTRVFRSENGGVSRFAHLLGTRGLAGEVLHRLGDADSGTSEKIREMLCALAPHIEDDERLLGQLYFELLRTIPDHQNTSFSFPVVRRIAAEVRYEEVEWHSRTAAGAAEEYLSIVRDSLASAETSPLRDALRTPRGIEMVCDFVSDLCQDGWYPARALYEKSVHEILHEVRALLGDEAPLSLRRAIRGIQQAGQSREDYLGERVSFMVAALADSSGSDRGRNIEQLGRFLTLNDVESREIAAGEIYIALSQRNISEEGIGALSEISERIAMHGSRSARALLKSGVRTALEVHRPRVSAIIVEKLDRAIAAMDTPAKGVREP